MLRLLVWYFGRGDDGCGGGDGGGGDDDYGLAKVVQLYIPCLWWCLHDLTNRLQRLLFPNNNNIYLIGKKLPTYLKGKAQVQEDNVRSYVFYLPDDGSRTYLKKSPSSRRQMSEAHDTEEEEKV